jgi:hypothetical protein
MPHRILKKFRKKLFDLLFPTYSKKYMKLKTLVARDPRVLLADILSDKLSYYNANLLVLETTAQDVAPFVKMLPEVAEMAKVRNTRLWTALCGRDNIEKLKNYYSDHPYSDEDIYELYNFYDLNDSKVFSAAFFGESLRLLQDVASKFYNVVDHVRVTTDVPAVFDRRIHFFGHCYGVGAHAEDAHTPASFLQRMLNKNPINSRAYKVINHSNWQLLEGFFSQILHPRYVFSSGDIAILLTSRRFTPWRDRYSNIFVYDSTDLFDGVQAGTDIFFDNYHTNHRGYELVAKKCFKIIQEFENTPPPPANANRFTQRGLGQLCGLPASFPFLCFDEQRPGRYRFHSHELQSLHSRPRIPDNQGAGKLRLSVYLPGRRRQIGFPLRVPEGHGPFRPGRPG